MAKRYTDTEKWKDDWYISLNNDYKIVFQWLLDNCNHAGICKRSLNLLNVMCKTSITENDLINNMDGRVIIKDNIWFIPKFLKFQYTNLKSNKAVIISVIKELKNNNLLDLIPKSFGNDYLIIDEPLGNDYITISKPLDNDYLIIKDKDKDKVTSNNTLNTNSNSIKKEYNTVTDSKDSNWETDKNNFTSDEQMQMNYKTVYGLTREEVVECINKFITQIELAQDYKDLKELRKHFKNWMNKKNPVSKFQKEVPQHNPKGYVVQTPMHLWDKNFEGEE